MGVKTKSLAALAIFFSLTYLLFAGSLLKPKAAAPANEELPFIYGGLAWSPDNSTIAVGTSEGVWLHSADDLAPLRLLVERPFITALDWSSNNRLALGHIEDIIEIWDMEAEAIALLLEGHESIITALDWSPDETMLVSSARGERTIRIWDAVTGHQIQAMAVLDTRSRSFIPSWSPDSRQVAIDDRVYDALTGEIVVSWDPSWYAISVQWGPAGYPIALGN